MNVTIKVRKDGPFLVTGGANLIDHEGRAVEPKNPDNFTLCRCGRSNTKPFCDRTHRDIEFVDPA
jgi:CDGSH-type Zn-finger protein